MTNLEKMTQEFQNEVNARIQSIMENESLRNSADTFMRETFTSQYSYNFSWLGRPIIQYPQDIVAVQELIWQCRPDLIIETEITHGGSLILSASMLSIIECCEAMKMGEILDPNCPKGLVIGLKYSY